MQTEPQPLQHRELGTCGVYLIHGGSAKIASILHVAALDDSMERRGGRASSTTLALFQQLRVRSQARRPTS